jgi:Kae1-associated kinase Bud32
MKIIQRGAESILYLDRVDGERILVKERIRKGYRVTKLDEKIRRRRTRKENKLMERARGFGVRIPKARVSGEFKILMDYIEGSKLKDVLNGMNTKDLESVCSEIGRVVSRLHESEIIHGDLTTSNMILDKNGNLYLIDFGLGKISSKIEDQAVDLFLLYEALKSTHFKILSKCWEKIIKVYLQKYSKAKDVLARFEQIKKRRRYKKQ